MTVMSVDPGEKNVGWATWTENGALIEKGIDSPDQFLSRLLTTRMSLVVVENWRLRKAVRGKTMATSEVIGMLMYHCAALGIPMIRQEPGILRITALHADVKLPKGHIPDDVSAYLHGYWYWESVGVLAPKPLDERG